MPDDKDRRGRFGGFDLGPSGDPSGRRMRTSPWVWIVAFLLVLVGFNFLAAPRPSGLDYSDFLQRVEDGQVTGTLKVSATSVSGTYDEDGDTVQFTSTIPPTDQGTTS